MFVLVAKYSNLVSYFSQGGAGEAGEVQHRGANDEAVHYSYTPEEQGLHDQFKSRSFSLV